MEEAGKIIVTIGKGKGEPPTEVRGSAAFAVVIDPEMEGVAENTEKPDECLMATGRFSRKKTPVALAHAVANFFEQTSDGKIEEYLGKLAFLEAFGEIIDSNRPMCHAVRVTKAAGDAADPEAEEAAGEDT